MIKSTTELVSDETYIIGSGEFLSTMAQPLDAVRCQLLKFESRQSYDEQGNESFDAFFAGDYKLAQELLASTKKAEAQVYSELMEKHVDFVRCRPVERPLTKYLRWEILNYRANLSLGERIFLANSRAVSSFLNQFAHHDFMTFDARFACVHDYDEAGKLKGGWFLEDPEKINGLIDIFSRIKANSVNFLSVYPASMDLLKELNLVSET